MRVRRRSANIGYSGREYPHATEHRSGAFGTHFRVDPQEKRIAIAMIQTSNQEFLRDFENMVIQAVVGSGARNNAGTN